MTSAIRASEGDANAKGSQLLRFSEIGPICIEPPQPADHRRAPERECP
jgi:hypothetical protein